MGNAPEQHGRGRVGAMLAFLAAFLACVAYLSLNPQLLGGPSSTRVTMDEDFSQGWTTRDGAPVNLNSLNAVPGFAEHGAVLQHTLPAYIESGIELNFLSKNITLRLLYDGVEVYSHSPDPDKYGMPYSAHFNYAPLTPLDAGRTVTLKVVPVYPSSACQVIDMRLSGTSAYIQRYVRNHGIAFIMSMVVVFVGLAVLVLDLALSDSNRGDLDLFSLGAISVLLGIWSGAETLVPQLVTGLAPLINALDYLALLFAPYPMVKFTESLVRPRHRKRYELVARVAAAAAIGSTMLLAMVRRDDMHELLIISHMQLVLCAMLIIAQVVSSFREKGRGLVRGMLEANRAIFVAFLIFVACAFADFVVYNLSARGTNDSAFFLRFGLFAFSVVLAVEAFRASIDYIKRANRAEAVEAIAYTDALTGVGNRTAWQIMRAEMEEALVSGIVDDALVCQIDVNFLKRVNDTLGHAAGDEHLKRAAETISRSFGTEGVCYRTGGDEFTVLMVGVTLDERLKQCEDLFELSLREQLESREGGEALSMAVGVACASETSQCTIVAAQQLADKRMYANKRAMKAERVD